ncbi:MAG: hypothetical protein HQM16_17435 [Deltaproteobacteria bacterium]|nr:hypothetical protein [Deltaproteobacteria bacterium]
MDSNSKYYTTEVIEETVENDNKKYSTATHVVKTGVKTIIGVGVGVLAGIASVFVAAHILEAAIPAMLITKTAGVVGGATGLLKGVNDAKKAA